MSATVDDFRALRDYRRHRRATEGVACQDCKRLLPRANPSILLPGQKCRMHAFRAPVKENT